MTTTTAVRVNGCPVGTITTEGTITATEAVTADRTRVTFDNGSTRTLGFRQALIVVTPA